MSFCRHQTETCGWRIGVAADTVAGQPRRREPVEELPVNGGDDLRDPGIQRAALASQFNVDLAPIANLAHGHALSLASSRSSRRDIGPASIPANSQKRDEVSASTGIKAAANAAAFLGGVEGASEVDMIGLRLSRGCHYIRRYSMWVADDASIPI
jgi:hypothetical protein